jgi:hypothetical protein
MSAASATSLIVSRACFLVPTNSTVPPRWASVAGELLRLGEQRLRLQQIDDVDAAALAKMKRRILGFQRRVWWPKWTPASSSSAMPTSATGCYSLVVMQFFGAAADGADPK